MKQILFIIDPFHDINPEKDTTILFMEMLELITFLKTFLGLIFFFMLGVKTETF